ncbi:glycosyltransferase family 2 protein, partial [Klebsiella oxytoca]
MKTPAVSVVISIYNGEQYLPECLESILAQTLEENIEIICVDDASTDATPQILDRYGDRITVLRN